MSKSLSLKTEAMTGCQHARLQLLYNACMRLLVVAQVADVQVFNIHSRVKLVNGKVRGSICCHSVLTSRDDRREG